MPLIHSTEIVIPCVPRNLTSSHGMYVLPDIHRSFEIIALMCINIPPRTYIIDPLGVSKPAEPLSILCMHNNIKGESLLLASICNTGLILIS